VDYFEGNIILPILYSLYQPNNHNTLNSKHTQGIHPKLRFNTEVEGEVPTETHSKSFIRTGATLINAPVYLENQIRPTRGK